MDPELAAQLHLLPQVRFTDLESSRHELARRVRRLPDVRRSWDVQVDLLQIASLGDGPPVAVHLVRPAETPSDLPLLLWMHSGGFALGSARSDLPWCAELSATLGLVVAAVEYRLAPETPFPGAVNDCYGALLHLFQHAGDYGVDPSAIAVGGQSAGGGLAASISLMARDRGDVPIVWQCLDAPVLDDRLRTPSMQQHVDTPVWTRSDAELCWDRYLGAEGPRRGGPDVPSYAAPARALDLGGLPSAYVAATELDPLRDEAIDYAVRLLAAGVSVELHSFPGAFHRSTLLDSASSRRISQALIQAIARALRSSRCPE
jgi:acetyl esterase/lipase